MRQPAMTPEGVGPSAIACVPHSSGWRAAASSVDAKVGLHETADGAFGCVRVQVTYDYDALVEWLSSKQTDPSTNLPLSAEQLCPNRMLRWLTTHPRAGHWTPPPPFPSCVHHAA